MSWRTEMHLASEQTLGAVLQDDHGNTITYDETGSYYMRVEGSMYMTMKPHEVDRTIFYGELDEERFKASKEQHPNDR